MGEGGFNEFVLHVNKMLQYIGDYVKVILIKGSSVATTVVNRQRNSDSIIKLINYLGLNKNKRWDNSVNAVIVLF